MSTENKTISIEVPEQRVAEFYAWYARFLAASERRGGRGRHGRHGRCEGRRGDAAEGSLSAQD